MQRVLRWEVPVDDAWHKIGAGDVVQVAARGHRERPGDLIEVWTLEEAADTTFKTVEALLRRVVTVIGTGHAAPENARHIGSVVVPWFGLVPSMLRGGKDSIEPRPGPVWHLFERYDPEAERQALAEQGRRLASVREDLIAQGGDPSELPVPLHPEPLPRPSIGGFECGHIVTIGTNGDKYEGQIGVVASLDHDHGWRLWVRVGRDVHDQHAPALYLSPDDIDLLEIS